MLDEAQRLGTGCGVAVEVDQRVPVMKRPFGAASTSTGKRSSG